MNGYGKYALWLGLILLVSMSVAACAGFNMGDVVRVKTPQAIQNATGLPSSTSLNVAEGEFQAWLTQQQQAGTQWRSNIEDGQQLAALWGELTLQQVAQFGPQVAGVPVLGAVFPALLGTLALFVKRPGDKAPAEIQAEKEASYKAGRRQLLSDLASAGIAVPVQIADEPK